MENPQIPSQDQNNLQKTKENDQFISDFAQMVKNEINTVEHKKRVKGLRGKKKAMVEALMAKLGIVIDAIKIVGISRGTHYLWMNNDQRYKEATEEAEEVVKDLAIKALYGKMFSEQSEKSIHFYLERKARDRGYGKFIQTEDVTPAPRKIQVQVIDNGNNKDLESISDERGSNPQ